MSMEEEAWFWILTLSTNVWLARGSMFSVTCNAGDLRCDPVDPTSFYQCKSGGIWRSMPCSSGTKWSQAVLTCVLSDSSYSTECPNDIEHSTTSRTSSSTSTTRIDTTVGTTHDTDLDLSTYSSVDSTLGIFLVSTQSNSLGNTLDALQDKTADTARNTVPNPTRFSSKFTIADTDVTTYYDKVYISSDSSVDTSSDTVIDATHTTHVNIAADDTSDTIMNSTVGNVFETTLDPSSDTPQDNTQQILNATTEDTCLCPTSNQRYLNITMAQLVTILEELKKELTLNKTFLSVFVRRKLSVKDDRKSSRIMGYTGASLLATPILVIVMSDLVGFFTHISVCRRRAIAPL